jgi:hypothetical protein
VIEILGAFGHSDDRDAVAILERLPGARALHHRQRL